MPERCVDASVALKWVLKDEIWQRKAWKFLRDSIEADFTLVAPPLFEYETESVLQQRLCSGVLTTTEADAALAELAIINIQIAVHPAMVERARSIARQFSQTRIYDSLYAALAELQNCEFWTADRKFFNAVKSELSFVKYLPDYS